MAYGMCVQVLIMFMSHNMFDFNDKILYNVHEGLFLYAYMYVLYLPTSVNESVNEYKISK